jgi:polyhydroxyalkanoate synthesis regulator phasin
MFELIKRTLLTGVGLAALTRDRVEELAREIANAAQLSAEKGDEFVKEAVARAEQTRTDIETQVQHMVNDALRKTDLPSRADIEALRARIDELEQKLATKSE